jgi:single-strand DNA-binding protein
MNVLSLTGNLGQDCRVAEVSGTTVCNFSVAMKSGFGDRATTVWIDCALWGKAAEGKLPEYLTKGQGVAASGELSTSDKDGKTYLKLRCNSVDLVGGKSDSSPAPSQAAPAPKAPSPAPADDFDDDIPF